MKSIFLALFIGVFSLGVYSNSLHNEFLWDDNVLIIENDSIKDWKYLKDNFVTHLYAGTQDASNFYRPVLKLSFMLDWAFWRDKVLGWHLANITLHTMNAVLIFFIFGIVLENRLASFITAMIFAVHPVFTSAVTYISGRGDPLALFFMLISFFFFLKARHAFSVLFFILAVLTKETAIILPLLLFAYDRISQDSKRGQTPFLPYIAVCAVYGALRFTVFNFPFAPTLTSGSTLYLRLLTMPKIIFMYLGLLVFPLGLHMERNVPYVKSFFEPEVMLSAAALIAIGFFVYKRIYKRDERVFFGIIWFLVALLPVSNIKALNMSMAEHWMYVPAIGLFSCVGVLLSRLMHKKLIWKIGASLAIGILVLFFSCVTVFQNRIWRNEKAFYENLLKYVPASYVGHTNMGNIYYREGKINLSIQEYKKALEICPHYTVAHFNLARRYIELRECEKAVWHGERAVAYFPTLAEPHYQLAIIYEFNKDGVRYGPGFERGKAISEYKKAIGIGPSYVWPHFNLAIVYEYSEKGERYVDPAQMELAKREYEKVLQLDPDNHMARENLRILLEKLK